MSIEEVERIMDETQDAIEYQRVSAGGFDSVFWVVSAKASALHLGVCSKSTRCWPGRCRRRMRTQCWLSWRPSLRYVSTANLLSCACSSSASQLISLFPSGRHGASQRAHRRAARRPRILREESRFAGSYNYKSMLFVLFWFVFFFPKCRIHNYCKLQWVGSKLLRLLRFWCIKFGLTLIQTLSQLSNIEDETNCRFLNKNKCKT